MQATWTDDYEKDYHPLEELVKMRAEMLEDLDRGYSVFSEKGQTVDIDIDPEGKDLVVSYAADPLELGLRNRIDQAIRRKNPARANELLKLRSRRTHQGVEKVGEALRREVQGRRVKVMETEGPPIRYTFSGSEVVPVLTEDLRSTIDPEHISRIIRRQQ